MVANFGPSKFNYDETLTTLRYANRAKNIKNKPRVNEDPKDAMLREFQEEISRLKAQLANVNPKGQLISKCPYEITVSSNIPTRLFLDFCLEIFCSFLGVPGSFLGFQGT